MLFLRLFTISLDYIILIVTIIFIFHNHIIFYLFNDIVF